MTNAARAWVAAAVSVLLIGGFLAADALDDEQATGGTLADTHWVVTEMAGVALVPDAVAFGRVHGDEGLRERRLQFGGRRPTPQRAARSPSVRCSRP